jgi:hypothetical protein
LNQNYLFSLFAVYGDARMAEGCYTACVNLLRRYNSISRVIAVQHLKGMRTAGRWQSDVWGIVSHFEAAQKAVARDKLMAAKLWLTNFTTNPSSNDEKQGEVED